jgi:hypothetical protein|tara:strand:+ start:96 stop:428 length:333 start_codon:yes stop_codon:yes gene_type:complete
LEKTRELERKMNLLTREHLNLTYRELFDDFNSEEADRLFIHLSEFERSISDLPKEELETIHEYIVSCPTLQKRLEFAEHDLLEFTPRQVELITLETEGLVSWYIKSRGEF